VTKVSESISSEVLLPTHQQSAYGRHSHHRCILIQLLHIHLIKSVRGRMMIAKVERESCEGLRPGTPSWTIPAISSAVPRQIW